MKLKECDCCEIDRNSIVYVACKVMKVNYISIWVVVVFFSKLQNEMNKLEAVGINLRSSHILI